MQVGGRAQASPQWAASCSVVQIAGAIWWAINPNRSFESLAPPLVPPLSPVPRQWQSCRQWGQMGTGVSDAGVPGDSFPRH